MRIRIAATAVAAAILVGAPAAGAHVTASPEEATAGSFAKIDLRVPHGCDDSATTAVSVKIPDGIVSATPEVNPGWTISKTMRTLDEPVEGEGGAISEVVDTITWEGGPLAPDELSEFGLSVRLPDTPGETLFFPTVQRCENGEVRWIQIPAEGQDPFDLDTPAPFVRLDADTADPVATDSSSNSTLAIVLGAAGLAAGLAALGLVLARRPKKT